jgi:hypothetical protein
LAGDPLFLAEELLRYAHWEGEAGLKEEALVDYPDEDGRFYEILRRQADLLGRLRSPGADPSLVGVPQVIKPGLIDL